MHLSRPNLINIIGDLCYCYYIGCRKCSMGVNKLCLQRPKIRQLALDFEQKGYKLIASYIYCAKLSCHSAQHTCPFLGDCECQRQSVWQDLDKEITRFIESEDFKDGYNFNDV